ncbi:MAG TPA: glycosyltransferase family 2 protein [Candidatus Eubacterium faecigallinarum]|nr:glycosyltransferase family 2 protein [Candidatus Eubacterium faecigallinarum]
MNEKVSVIVACYNVEDYLEKCLDSIVNQTYDNLEIICVNDGSADQTQTILENYLKKDDRIVVINQKNLGVSIARNKALDAATGAYVSFVDGDDWMELTAIEKAVSKIEELNCDLVFWSYNKGFSNKSIKNYIYGEESKLLKGQDYEDFYRLFFGTTGKRLEHPELADSICTIWGKLYRKNIICDIRFVDINTIGTLEDCLFNIHYLLNGSSAYYLAECLYDYRRNNEGSITTKYKKDLFDKWQNLYSIMDDFITQNQLDSSFSNALSNRIAMGVIGLGLQELGNADGAVKQISNLRKILHTDKYKRVYKNFDLQYFPIHWKVFFFCAKYRLTIGLYILLKAANAMRGKFE